MTLGIIFPPAILLLDFRLGDEASFHSSKENKDSRAKDEDNKSSKVVTSQSIFIVLSFQQCDDAFMLGCCLQRGHHFKERRRRRWAEETQEDSCWEEDLWVLQRSIHKVLVQHSKLCPALSIQINGFIMEHNGNDCGSVIFFRTTLSRAMLVPTDQQLQLTAEPVVVLLSSLETWLYWSGSTQRTPTVIKHFKIHH